MPNNDYLKLKELYHSGIKGQKWGVRRYQNPDGTLTEEGKKRYGVDEVRNNTNDYIKTLDKMSQDEIVDYFDTGINLNKHREEFEEKYREICKDFLNKNAKKVKEIESITGKKIDINLLAPTSKEYFNSSFDFQDLIYDNDNLTEGQIKFIYELDNHFMTFASLYEDPHFGRDRLYQSDNDINNILEHHGIKGQKWGLRRYQNEDGSLTKEGRKKQESYKKALNEELRETTHQISLRNYSKYDSEASALGIGEEANKKAMASFSRGEKIVNKMIKDGFLSDKATYNDFRKLYEKQISEGYSQYCKIMELNPNDAKNLEWYFYSSTIKK